MVPSCRLAGTRPLTLPQCIANPSYSWYPRPITWQREKGYVREVAGHEFVMYERTYAPGFHDLILGLLRGAGIVPNVSQTAAEISTLISLVAAHMGVAILPASPVKHGVASVIACDIVDKDTRV
jgi:DNA-binding transcriptional LysR family regulator